VVDSIGIIGGSGPLGRGLAGRFAQVGIDVTIGSRDRDRAEQTAAAVTAALDEAASGDEQRGVVDGGLNPDVLDRDVVIVTLPWDGLEAILQACADGLAGRLVVSTVNPLGFDGGPHPVRLPAGSGAETVASLLPGARLTAAFHSVASQHLLRFGKPMDDDVPVVGDDPDDVDTIVRLVDRIAGMRGLAAGPLRLAAPLEDLTAVIISINRAAKRHVGLRFSRLPTA
jgi:8-hydroxy-5-deazaflavin:NADPH oxidoreductase